MAGFILIRIYASRVHKISLKLFLEEGVLLYYVVLHFYLWLLRHEKLFWHHTTCIRTKSDSVC